MQVQAMLVVVLMLGLLPALLSSRPTHAQDESGTAPGTPYEGTQEAGGPVRMIVTDTRVTLFEIEGVAGGGCSWDTITLANWGGDIALSDHAFSATNPDGDTLAGALVTPADQPPHFEGTIQVRDPNKGCETPPLRWVAGVVR